MGGLIMGPSAPSMPAPAALPPQPDVALEERKARVDALERRRRGRAGTIHTTDRGVLGQNATAPKKKSLLGE